jgi:hypothetical protein
MLEIMDVAGVERWIQSRLSHGFRHGWGSDDGPYILLIDVKLNLGSVSGGEGPMNATAGIVLLRLDGGAPIITRPVFNEFTSQTLFEVGKESAQAIRKALLSDG